MNREEEVAKKYLEGLGLGELVYEPDGNVPPDFLIGGRIAVEVRRLNQHYLKSGQVRSLEEDTIPLWQSTEKLLEEFGPPKDGRSWFVFFRLKRPLPSWGKLNSLTRACLSRFLLSPSPGPIRFELADGFAITLLESSNVQKGVFCLGGRTDFDAGGFVVSELIRNMAEYIREKELKTGPYRRRYLEWWLVFIDQIGYANDRKELKEYLSKPEGWDKVILVSPLGDRAYEI